MIKRVNLILVMGEDEFNQIEQARLKSNRNRSNYYFNCALQEAKRINKGD